MLYLVDRYARLHTYLFGAYTYRRYMVLSSRMHLTLFDRHPQQHAHCAQFAHAPTITAAVVTTATVAPWPDDGSLPDMRHVPGVGSFSPRSSKGEGT